MPLRPGLVLPLILAALLGCAEGDRAAATADDSEMPSPDTARDSWILSESGIGRVRAGMSLGEARQALGRPLALAYEVFDDCDMLEIPGGPAGVTLMVVADTVVRVDVFDPGVRTVAGAGIGDSEQRLRELYRGIRSEPHKYSDGRYLIVTSPADTLYRFVFETDAEGVVTTFRSGRTPEVHWVEGCA